MSQSDVNNKRSIDVLDINRPNALHPNKKKRTSDLSESQLVIGQELAGSVALLAGPQPKINSICDVVDRLLHAYSFESLTDFSSHFPTLDDFVEWLCKLDPKPNSLPTLKAAFKKYLLGPPIYLPAQKTQRAFLDTRETTEAHRALVRKLAPNAEKEAIWFHATKMTGFVDEDMMRQADPKTVYDAFGAKASDIMKKGNLPKKEIVNTLLAFGIGSPYDAYANGNRNIRPGDIATQEQLNLYRSFIDTMKESPVTGSRNYFASSWMQNTFLHLLLHNPYIKHENDIAEKGFERTDISAKRVLAARSETLRAIQNVYRLRCGMEMIHQERDVRNNRELTSYQDRVLGDLANVNEESALWVESVSCKHRQRCLARNLCVTTTDGYGNVFAQFLAFHCGANRCASSTEIATTLNTLRKRIIEFAYDWYNKSESDNVKGFVRKIVSSINLILNTDEFPIEGSMNQREVLAEFYETYTDVPIPEKNEEVDNDADVDHAGRKRDYFTEEELVAMDGHIGTMDARTQLIYTLFKNTGLRMNALRNLKVSGVWNSVLNIPLEYGHAAEKRKTTRIFAIRRDEHLQSCLMKYIQQNPILLEAKTFLFPAIGMNMSKPIGRSSLAKLVKTTCTAVNINGRHVHPHAFRKTLIIRLAREGNSVEKIAKYVGHSNSKTTFDFYYTPTLADLTSTMHIPWLKPGPNEITLADLGKLTQDKEPTESSLTSSDNFKTFLENNYVPLVQRVHALQAELSFTQSFIEHLSDEQKIKYRNDLEKCRQTVQDKVDTNAVTMDELLNDTDLDKIEEDDDEEEPTGNTTVVADS